MVTPGSANGLSPFGGGNFRNYTATPGDFSDDGRADLLYIPLPSAPALPKWNPVNICSYHLQEAGATPVQELAFALANAAALLDAVRAGGQVPAAEFAQVVGRISFFVNAGIRFVTEMCKMRAFVELWDRLCRDRFGIEDEKFRRFRYGVQVNSLGLTEQQPENNVYRILLEMLAVVLSKNARARAVQLPAWNEALGLPRPWDQQWSLRLQQIVAFETDLLEYGDLFDGSAVVAAKVAELIAEATQEFERIQALGGATAAIDYMKQRLVEANAKRLAAIERGEQIVVGVNEFTETAPSPLTGAEDAGILTLDEGVEREQIERLAAWRAARDPAAVAAALAGLRQAASQNRNIMEPSIAAAKAGITTGEWGRALREAYGEYRGPTGVGQATASRGSGKEAILAVRARVAEVSTQRGRRLKLLIGKPGLDGHSNGAEQIALKARDAGFEVVYEGIRLTPAQIVNAALEEGVHVVGLSILSGSHVALVGDVLAGLKAAGLEDIPVVVGGIIPPDDAAALIAAGVARVYTPKDFDLTRIIADIVELVAAAGRIAA